MLAAVIDAFRQGQWQLMAFVQTADELSSTFSAFSLLWWIRRAESPSGKFPVDGVAYAKARGLLHNFIWFLSFMALRAAPSEAEQRQLINKMPTLYALETHFRAIFHQRQGSRGVSMERAWDVSAASKNKFTYQMLQDVDMVLTCIYDLIHPVEQPKVYYPVFSRLDPATILYNLWCFYPQHQFPQHLLAPSLDCPNFSQAVTTRAEGFESAWRSYLHRDSTGFADPPKFARPMVERIL
jgi:hypothetical protein